MKKLVFSIILLVLWVMNTDAQIDLNFPKSTPADSTITKQNKIVYKFSINGVITASAFGQDGVFGLGDGAITMWANAEQPQTNKYQSGTDIRKSWLILKSTAYNLPKGWEATARIEFDLLGGFAGAGGFADENITPRLRLGYIELFKNKTRIRIGQNWTPLVAFFPVSVNHFAMGYGAAGGIGFRNPGVFLYQHLNRSSSNIKTRIDAAVFRGTWLGTFSTDPLKRDEGEIGIPQMELGFNLSRMDQPLKWELSLVGHYDQKNIYNPVPKTYSKLDGKAIQVGGKLLFKDFSIQANAYTGRAIGHLWGNLMQFGDISGNGAWAQASFKPYKNWSIWLMTGYDDPKDSEVLTAVTGNSRLNNKIIVPMIRYDLGPIQIGLEWYHATTKWNIQKATINQLSTTKANQLALGASYTF